MYIAELLQAAGIDATHEGLWRLQPGSPVYFGDCGDVEVSSDAGLMLHEVAPVAESVGHVVRHPQQVVASIVGRGLWDTLWALRIEREYPRVAYYSSVHDRALAYWLDHNARIEMVLGHDPRYVRFPLHDPADGLRRALRLARLPDVLEPALSLVAKSTNAGTPTLYDWRSHDANLRASAEGLMEEYGLREAVPA